MLELAEEAFDEITLSVEPWVDGALDLAVALCRDVGTNTRGGCQVDEGTGIVTAIGDQVVGARECRDQGGGGLLVGGLSGGQCEADGQALAIDDGIDLGAQSSTRTTDGVIRTPFLPPAAC